MPCDGQRREPQGAGQECWMVQVLREHKNMRIGQLLTGKMTNLLLMKYVHLPDDDDEEEISTYGRKRNYEKNLITARLSAINSTGNHKVERTLKL